MKRFPSRCGSYLLKNEGGSISVYDKIGKVATIGPAIYRNNGDNGDKAVPLTATTITAGAKHRGMLGAGTTIAKTFTGANRTVTQTVALTTVGLSITHSVTYGADTAVAKEGCYIDIRRPLQLMADKEAIVPIVGGRHFLCTDNGDYNQSMLIDPTANPVSPYYVYKNYQTRANTTTRAARLQAALKSTTPALQIMSAPSGANAVLIFTNHADRTNTERVKAVHYGSSDGSVLDKGFTGRGLKTTWSVFHTGNVDNMGLDTPAFKTAIDALYAAGHEIIPHRTRPGSVNTRIDCQDTGDGGNNHLADFDTWYSCRNWIDHGLSAGPDNVGLHVKGSTLGETNYIMDLLEAKGYEYTWNWIDMLPRRASAMPLNLLDYSYVGLPRHLVWQNTNMQLPTAGPLWQWAANCWADGAALLSHLANANIDTLIAEFGVSILHNYFALNTYDGYTYTSGSPYLIAAAFDDLLAYIQTKQTAGSLWVPTLSEWGDYFRKIIQVDIAITSEKTYTVTNNSGGIISGFALRVPKVCVPKIGGVDMTVKTVGTTTICWADLPVGASTITI